MNFLARSAYATFVPFHSLSQKPNSRLEWPSLEPQDRSAIRCFSGSRTETCLDTTNLLSSTSSIFLKPRKRFQELLWSLETALSLFCMESSALMTLKLVRKELLRFYWCRSCAAGWSQAERKGNGERRPSSGKCENFHSSRKGHQRLCP